MALCQEVGPCSECGGILKLQTRRATTGGSKSIYECGACGTLFEFIAQFVDGDPECSITKTSAAEWRDGYKSDRPAPLCYECGTRLELTREAERPDIPDLYVCPGCVKRVGDIDGRRGDR
jgi:DNA-directed RNA polymerase subunit RPC12/RpoP